MRYPCSLISGVLSSASQLNIGDIEVPESQVVGEHVELGQEGGPGLIDGGDLVEPVEVYNGLLPDEGEKELHDGPQRVLKQLRLLQCGEGMEVCDGLQLWQEGQQEELFLLLRDSQ